MHPRAERGQGDVQLPRQPGKIRGAIVLLDLPQGGQHKAVAGSFRKILRTVEQLHHQKAHRRLVDPPAIGLRMHEAPHQVFHQILHGEHIRNQKMQVIPARPVLPQAAQQEFAQYIVRSDQGQRIIEELREHDEIGAYVFFAGPLHAMHGVLIEKQQLARRSVRGGLPSIWWIVCPLHMYTIST